MEQNGHRISSRHCWFHIDAEDPWSRWSICCECLSRAALFENNLHSSGLHGFERSSHCGEMHVKPGILASYEGRILHKELSLVGPTCHARRLGLVRGNL